MHHLSCCWGFWRNLGMATAWDWYVRIDIVWNSMGYKQLQEPLWMRAAFTVVLNTIHWCKCTGTPRTTTRVKWSLMVLDTANLSHQTQLEQEVPSRNYKNDITATATIFLKLHDSEQLQASFRKYWWCFQSSATSANHKVKSLSYCFDILPFFHWNDNENFATSDIKQFTFHLIGSSPVPSKTPQWFQVFLASPKINLCHLHFFEFTLKEVLFFRRLGLFVDQS